VNYHCKLLQEVCYFYPILTKLYVKDTGSVWGSKQIANSGKAGCKRPSRPCSLERYNPSKCRELHTHRNSVTYPRTATVL